VEADEDKLEGLSLARDLKDLKREIEGLEGLELAAKHLRRSEHDSKWRALKEALAKDVHSEKLIIFTEHRDTLTYLADKLGDYLGNTDAVVIICGGMTMKARKAVEERFKTDPAVQVLVATDAAGEGINLQAAHLMINYDLPWNPNRIEQRFGRIHRIGQKHTCHLWNLVAMRTREGEVFNRLFEKLERERRALGGQVFDVLGKVAYGGETLRELLLRAVMEAAPESTVEQTLDAAFNRSTMQKLLQEYELDMRDFGARELCAIREEKERADASRLQPFYIKEFFEKAYKRINGRVREIGNKRFCIDEVERVLWKRHPKVAQRYAALTFDKNSVRIAGLEDAELVCPGHPLLEALVAFFLEKDYIKKGTVFVSGRNAEARLLFYIEDFIRDKRGEEIVHSLHFIECDIEGKRVLYAGTDAPHVDYRAQKPEEEEFVRKLREEMQMNLEEASAFVLDYVERELSKPRFAKLNDENEERLAKLRFELVKTIDGDINFYDKKAAEQWDKHGAGAPFAREKALEYTKRIDDLKERKRQRIAELEREGLVEPAPPVLLGLALVVPDYCLRENTAGPDTAARIRVERLAMQAVVKHEREIGNLPRDVSRECCGYDIESTLPGGVLRFIEVKGVSKGLETLTLTSNEINTAQNSRENFILALVEVEGNSVLSLRYQCNLPLEKLGIAEVARTYKIAGLCAESEVVYDA
jgi:hypothetical protein